MKISIFILVFIFSSLLLSLLALFNYSHFAACSQRSIFRRYSLNWLNIHIIFFLIFFLLHSSLFSIFAGMGNCRRIGTSFFRLFFIDFLLISFLYLVCIENLLSRMINFFLQFLNQ